MKVIKKNIKNGEISLKIESLDDMWYLSQIVEPSDLVRGKTVRKIKLGDSEQRKSQIIKRTVFIELLVEKVEFHEYGSFLRISGLIKEGPEDISKGSHHTFNIEPGSVITIVKSHWPKYMLEKIREASFNKSKNILLCVLERDNAVFAIMKRGGFEMLSEIKGDVEKKYDFKTTPKDFYGEIIASLKEYVSRYNIEHIIVASPAFWKEELLNSIKDEKLKSNIVLATCSTGGKSAFSEVIARPELKSLLEKQNIAKQQKAVDSLLFNLSRNDKAVYGLDETEKAANLGAVETLLVTDGFIREKRRNNDFQRLERLMKTVEDMNGVVNIISSNNGPGKKLDGLGGIAAILRYNINYY